MRIGIYSPNWIGDSVIALTFVQSIRAFESDAEIFIVCKEWVAGVYQEHPAIDGVLSFSSIQFSGLANIYKMGSSLKKYNFDKIVLPYIQEVRPPGNVNVGLPVECLSDKNKDDMISTRRYKYTSPSSGMDALLYCVNDLNAKTVNMIGMDFYDDIGYFTNSYGRHEGENNTKSVMKRMQGSDHDMIHMKKFFYKFIENHKDVQFNLWTYANIENRDNLLIKEL